MDCKAEVAINEGRWKLAESRAIEAEEDLRKTRLALSEAKRELRKVSEEREFFKEAAQTFLDDILQAKAFLMDKLKTIRLDSARAFLGSWAYKTAREADLRSGRAAGFTAAIGQVALKGWIPAGTNLKEAGLSHNKDAAGVEIPPPKISNQAFYGDEFVELVDVARGVEKKTHKGPFLPNWVPSFLRYLVQAPFDNFTEYHKKCFSLPAPVLGMPEDYDVYTVLREETLQDDAMLAEKYAKEQKEAEEAQDAQGNPSGSNPSGSKSSV